jgi:hypothetical protein
MGETHRLQARENSIPLPGPPDTRLTMLPAEPFRARPARRRPIDGRQSCFFWRVVADDGVFGRDRLPRNGWQPPSGLRACESRHQYAAGPRGSAPSATPSGGGAIRDAIAPRCPVAPARAPCADGARSSPTPSKTADLASRDADVTPASHSVELLPEPEVLKNQFLMPAAGERQCSGNQHSHFHYVVDRVVVARENQPAWAGCSSVDGQSHG